MLHEVVVRKRVFKSSRIDPNPSRQDTEKPRERWENRGGGCDQKAPRGTATCRPDASPNLRDRRDPEGHRLVHERRGHQRGHNGFARLLLQSLRRTRTQSALVPHILERSPLPLSFHPHAHHRHHRPPHRRGVETIPTICTLDTGVLRGFSIGIRHDPGVDPPQPHRHTTGNDDGVP